MSKNEKLLLKFLSNPKDLTWNEFCKVLKYMGFTEVSKGKTSGSRRRFRHASGAEVKTHEPHPDKIVKGYVLKEVIQILEKENLL